MGAHAPKRLRNSPPPMPASSPSSILPSDNRKVRQSSAFIGSIRVRPSFRRTGSHHGSSHAMHRTGTWLTFWRASSRRSPHSRRGILSAVWFCVRQARRHGRDFAIWLSALIFAHGDRILRMKGLLHDQARDTWLAVHGVRRFLHPPEHLQLGRGSMRDASLVFIVDGLDPALIERSYRQWVLAESDRDARPLAKIDAADLVPESTAMALAMNEGVAR